MGLQPHVCLNLGSLKVTISVFFSVLSLYVARSAQKHHWGFKLEERRMRHEPKVFDKMYICCNSIIGQYYILL